MKKYIVSLILIPALLCTVHTDAGNECSMGKKCSMGKDIPSAHAAESVKPVVNLASQGKKNMLPDGGWFTWEFSEKPMLGTVIIKVQVFAKNGKTTKTV